MSSPYGDFLDDLVHALPDFLQPREFTLEPHSPPPDGIDLDREFDMDITTGGVAHADARWWNEQVANDTCAVVAQQGIIEAFVGHDIPQEEVVQVALDHGWYRPGQGTLPECVGNVLEHYGVPVERGFDCSLDELYSALLDGRKVIVGIDANEIWEPQADWSGSPREIAGGANHAVWVTGIGPDDNGNLCVVLNDSGTPGGRESHVPVQDFLNAWEDSSNFAVITERAPGQSLVA